MLNVERAIAVLTAVLIPAVSLAGAATAEPRGKPAIVQPAAKAIPNQAKLLQLTPVIFLPKSGKFGAGSGIVHKTQDPECFACREICVEDYKIDCDDSERRCRQLFVRCMRYCWENVCR